MPKTLRQVELRYFLHAPYSGGVTFVVGSTFKNLANSEPRSLSFSTGAFVARSNSDQAFRIAVCGGAEELRTSSGSHRKGRSTAQ
jgi:hypothetical protein